MNGRALQRVLSWAVLGLIGCKAQPAAPPLLGMTAERHQALFPISSGKHGGLDCGACHLEADSFSAFSCITCHEHRQEKVDGIHVGVEAAAGYQYEAKACYACHPQGEPGGFDHTAHFPIAAGTVHQGVECGVCHVESGNKKVFSCVGCHTEEKTASAASNITARHSAVAGYVHESAACYQCHPDAKLPTLNVDHAAFFPIGPGSKHQAASCGSCHPNPQDRTQFDCTTCHTDSSTTPNHTGVSGYQWASPSCYGCHPQANPVGADFVHTSFPIAAGDRHANIACATCHTTPGRKDLFSCVGCHTEPTTNPRHATVSGYQWDSASCYQCHPQANVESSVNHALYFPIDAAAVHRNIPCATCHINPTNRQQQGCAGSCHPQAATSSQHTAVGGYQYASASCVRCHADSQVNAVAAHLPFRIQSGARHYRSSCLACHPTSRVDKPFGASFALAGLACESCHPKTRSHFNRAAQTCVQAGCHPDGRKP